MNNRQIKEPIRKPWIWVALVFVMLAAIPWYLPKGTMGFVLLGVPYWMFISVAFTLLMCAYVSWLCFTQWDLVEAEEAEHSDGSDNTDPTSDSRNGRG